MRTAIAIAAAALSLSACATVTRGTSDTLQVQTTPSQANVRTTNGFACVSPCALKMPRRSEFDVDISKAGYKPARVHVTHQVAGAGAAGMAGNVIVGGVIGVAVDAGSGAMLDLVPNPVSVALEPIGPTGAPVATLASRN